MVKEPADLAKVAIFAAQQADSGDIFMDHTFRELVLKLCSLAAPLRQRRVAFLDIARSSSLRRAAGRAEFMVNTAFLVGIEPDQVTAALTHSRTDHSGEDWAYQR